VALIGGNGVGSRRLLRIIAGEDTEYSGTARVDGSFLYIGSSSPPGYDGPRPAARSAATASRGGSGADGG